MSANEKGQQRFFADRMCMCFIMAWVDSKTSLLRKRTLFLAQGHGHPNRSFIHVLGSGSSWVVVSLQNHDLFAFMSQDVPEMNRMFHSVF